MPHKEKLELAQEAIKRLQNQVATDCALRFHDAVDWYQAETRGTMYLHLVFEFSPPLRCKKHAAMHRLLSFTSFAFRHSPNCPGSHSARGAPKLQEASLRTDQSHAAEREGRGQWGRGS